MASVSLHGIQRHPRTSSGSTLLKTTYIGGSSPATFAWRAVLMDEGCHCRATLGLQRGLDDRYRVRTHLRESQTDTPTTSSPPSGAELIRAQHAARRQVRGLHARSKSERAPGFDADGARRYPDVVLVHVRSFAEAPLVSSRARRAARSIMPQPPARNGPRDAASVRGRVATTGVFLAHELIVPTSTALCGSRESRTRRDTNPVTHEPENGLFRTSLVMLGIRPLESTHSFCSDAGSRPR